MKLLTLEAASNMARHVTVNFLHSPANKTNDPNDNHGWGEYLPWIELSVQMYKFPLNKTIHKAEDFDFLIRDEGQ